MTRHVTIPFPEGLNGDYACACDNHAAPSPAAAAAAPSAVEAARAFRASLMRLASPAEAAEPGAAGPLPANTPTRLAA